MNIILGYFAIHNNPIINILSRAYIFILLVWTFIGMYYFSTAFISEEEFKAIFNAYDALINIYEDVASFNFIDYIFHLILLNGFFC